MNMEIAQSIKDEAKAMGTYPIVKHNLDNQTMVVIAPAPDDSVFAWVQYTSPIGTTEVHSFEDNTFSHFDDIVNAWENACEASWEAYQDRTLHD